MECQTNVNLTLINSFVWTWNGHLWLISETRVYKKNYCCKIVDNEYTYSDTFKEIYSAILHFVKHLFQRFWVRFFTILIRVWPAVLFVHMQSCRGKILRFFKNIHRQRNSIRKNSSTMPWLYPDIKKCIHYLYKKHDKVFFQHYMKYYTVMIHRAKVLICLQFLVMLYEV